MPRRFPPLAWRAASVPRVHEPLESRLVGGANIPNLLPLARIDSNPLVTKIVEDPSVNTPKPNLHRIAQLAEVPGTHHRSHCASP